MLNYSVVGEKYVEKCENWVLKFFEFDGIIIDAFKLYLKKRRSNMKKDFIFAPIMLVIGILLFLLSATGMIAHIVISALGVCTLVAYAVLTRKEWKIPALEIAMRVMYGISLIFGIVIKVNYIPGLAIAHKVTAGLFLAMLLVLFIHKLCLFLKEKKAVAEVELTEEPTEEPAPEEAAEETPEAEPVQEN